MIIQYNSVAANQNRIFAGVIMGKKKASEKLSSGYRINRAADDAAGLSISEKMRNQIRGLKRASDNAMEGISLIQTAEGALQEMHQMLQRMGELSVQAANDTNSLQEREALQEEINQIKKEVDRISDTTEFNRQKIFDGSFGVQTTTSNVNPLRTQKTAPNLYFFEEITFYQDTIIKNPSYRNSLEPEWAGVVEVLKEEIVPQAVTELLELFPDTFGYLEDANLGIGLTMANNDTSGVLASVTLRTAHSSDVPPVVELSYSLHVNAAYISFDSTNNNYPTEASRENLESTITHEMMHGFMMDTLTAGMIGYNQNMVRETAFPGWFVEGTAQAVGGGMDVVKRQLGIDENTTEAEISAKLSGADRLTTDTNTSLYGTGYLAVMYLGYLAAGENSMSASTVAGGLDLLMNEVRGGTSLDQAIAKHTNQKFTGLGDFEANFAREGAGFVKELVSQVGSGRGALVGGNYMERDLLDNAAIDQPLFQLHTEHEEVWHIYPDDYPVISGGTAYESGISGPEHAGTGGGGTTPDPDPSVPGTGGGGTTPDPDPSVPGTGGGGGNTPGNLKGGLSLQIGSMPGQKMTLFIESVDARTLGIDQIDVTTYQGANLGIAAVQNAINLVSKQRASLGAYQNRLEHTIQNLDNVAENTQAAESRIRDTDMAKEMVEFSKLEILEQAGSSLLAQANANPQAVLKLLSV